MTKLHLCNPTLKVIGEVKKYVAEKDIVFLDFNTFPETSHIAPGSFSYTFLPITDVLDVLEKGTREALQPSFKVYSPSVLDMFVHVYVGYVEGWYSFESFEKAERMFLAGIRSKGHVFLLNDMHNHPFKDYYAKIVEDHRLKTANDPQYFQNYFRNFSSPLE